MFTKLVDFVDFLTGGTLLDDDECPYSKNRNVRKMEHEPYVRFVLIPEVLCICHVCMCTSITIMKFLFTTKV